MAVAAGNVAPNFVKSFKTVEDDKIRIAFGEASDLFLALSITHMGSSALPLKGPRTTPEELVEMTIRALERIRQFPRKHEKVWLVASKQAFGLVDKKHTSLIHACGIFNIAKVKDVTSKDSANKGRDVVFYILEFNQRLGIVYVHYFISRQPHKFQATLGAISAAWKANPNGPTEVRLHSDMEDIDMKEKMVMGIFEGTYLGAVGIAAKKGDAAVKVAYESFHAKSKKKHKVSSDAETILIVSPEGINVYEALSEHLHFSFFIKFITFVTVLDEGQPLEVFALVEDNELLNQTTCHFFSCDKEVPDEICRSFGRARDHAIEQQESESHNPFQAVTVNSDVVEGVLNTCEVARESLSPIKVLGSGQYGTVYLANIHDASTNVEQACAVKLLRHTSGRDVEEEFKREAEIMKTLEHKYVVKLVGVAMTQRPWLVIIELMQYGDLSKVLQTLNMRKIELSFLEMLVLTRPIATAMAYVRKQGFVHMDIAARNILLHENNLVKLTDFGVSNKVNEEGFYKLKKVMSLPVRWMAKETLKGKAIFSEATDVYAYGVYLWEVVTHGDLPYGDLSSVQAKNAVIAGTKLQIPADAPEEFKEAMINCWNDEPTQRPKFEELDKKLSKLEVKEFDIAPNPRDIGLLLNAEASDNVKRLSRRASELRSVKLSSSTLLSSHSASTIEVIKEEEETESEKPVAE